VRRRGQKRKKKQKEKKKPPRTREKVERRRGGQRVGHKKERCLIPEGKPPRGLIQKLPSNPCSDWMGIERDKAKNSSASHSPPTGLKKGSRNKVGPQTRHFAEGKSGGRETGEMNNVSRILLKGNPGTPGQLKKSKNKKREWWKEEDGCRGKIPCDELGEVTRARSRKKRWGKPDKRVRQKTRAEKVSGKRPPETERSGKSSDLKEKPARNEWPAPLQKLKKSQWKNTNKQPNKKAGVNKKKTLNPPDKKKKQKRKKKKKSQSF